MKAAPFLVNLTVPPVHQESSEEAFLPQAKITCLADIMKRFSAAFKVITPPSDIPCVSAALLPEGPKLLSHQVAVTGSRGAGISILPQSKEEFAACLNQPYVCWLGVVTRRTPDKSLGAQPASLYQMGQCQSSLFSQGDSRRCSP